MEAAGSALEAAAAAEGSALVAAAERGWVGKSLGWAGLEAGSGRPDEVSWVALVVSGSATSLGWAAGWAVAAAAGSDAGLG